MSNKDNDVFLEEFQNFMRKLREEHGTIYFKHKRKGSLYRLCAETNVNTENLSFVPTYVYSEIECDPSVVDQIHVRSIKVRNETLYSRPKHEFLEKFEPILPPNSFKSCVVIHSGRNRMFPIQKKACDCEDFVPYNPKGVVSPMVPLGNCIYCGLPPTVSQGDQNET